MRNNVWIQNPIFASISGDAIKASVSGNVIYIGNTVDNRVASIVGGFDDHSGTGNNGLVTEDMMHAYDELADRWVRLRAKAFISGNGYNLLTTAIIQNTAGVAANVTSTDSDTDSSSQAGLADNALVNKSFMYAVHDVNGKWARVRVTTPISGQGYRLASTISGDTVHDNGTAVVTAPMVACAGTSGGTQLPNVPCIKARVRSISGNDVMFVGGIGGHAPFSGKGQQLYGGEMVDIPVTNFNAVSVFAVTANQMVSVDGVL